ncbi:MAG: glycoside hydrolase family 95 protein [Firmicutes bacterium]|nr:glycoside hydrolase family 95 protein [Bacillota bacterium]
MQLKYNQPAQTWEEALPLGNGRIGAMLFSNPLCEKISLNEDTLWSGFSNIKTLGAAQTRQDAALDPQGASPLDPLIFYEDREDSLEGENISQYFERARDLAMRHKYQQAQEVVEQHLLGDYTQGYLPLGDLFLDMLDKSQVENFERYLDLQNAVCVAKYQQNGVNFTRETFVSAPNQLLVMRLCADKTAALNFDLFFTCQLKHKTFANANQLTLEGIAPSTARPSYHMTENPIIYDETKNSVKFTAVADVQTIGGKITANGDKLTISLANEVILRFACRTSYNNKITCAQDLASEKAYQKLWENHVSDYQILYNRVFIDLGTGDDHLPISKRLENFNNLQNDISIFALLFQYGRYLMIAGSRHGTMPLNLQGIWNPHLHPPWSSNYTLNINTEMNYWAAETANLAECHTPLFDFVNRLRVTGAKIAKTHYNAGGFVVHHNSDLWAAANPVGEKGKGSAVYAFWAMAAGWLSAHTFDHYLFSMDKNFLQNTALPIIKDAAQFYLDVLTEDTDGTLIFAPSTSPENNFTVDENTPCAVSKTTTMTTAIIRETFTNFVQTCQILDLEDSILEKIKLALPRLPTYKIGSRGELLEWSEELPEHEPNHRHTSHLYPLYPGHEIQAGTPLATACETTLRLRGEEGTGWALAWRINLWARLHNGEKAFECLKKQLRLATENMGGCYLNLFGAHPPFQIDSNFGTCAGIIEMFLQSRANNVILLLPALPSAFQNGKITGLRARGGVTVSIYFAKGQLKKAELTLNKNLSSQNFTVIYKQTEQKIKLNPGQPVII